MSAASYIACAASRRLVADNAVFMIHNPWSMAIGDHQDFEREADVLRRLTATLARGYSRAAGISEEDAISIMSAETYYFGAEAVDAGFADSVFDSRTEEEQPKEEAEEAAALALADCQARMAHSKRREDLHRAAALAGAGEKKYMVHNKPKAEVEAGASEQAPAEESKPKAAPGPGVSHAELDAALQKFAEELNAAMATKADGEGSPGNLTIDISTAVLDEGGESEPSTDGDDSTEGGEQTAQSVRAERKRVAGFFAYLDADPGNESLRAIALKGVRSGASLESLRPQLEVALRNGGRRASGENPPDVATDPVSRIKADPQAEIVAARLGVTVEQMAAAAERRARN